MKMPESTLEKQVRYDALDKTKWIFEYIRAWTNVIDKFEQLLEVEKLSPEAKRFTAKKIGQLIEKIQGLRELLEETKCTPTITPGKNTPKLHG
jgi:hypothetical protein